MNTENNATPAPTPTPDEPMSLHEALRIALSEIYGLLDTFELMDPEEQQTMWINPPEALREAARVIDSHMRTLRHIDRLKGQKGVKK
jgi:transposase